MDKKRVIRLIIEDHEDVIYWSNDITKSTLNQLIVYIIDQLRKKYSTDAFSYRDFENKHYQLESIAEYEISPVFLNIPHRKDVRTSNKVDPRTMKNVYMFKDLETVRIQKFDNLKRYEEVEIKLDVIDMNVSNKDTKYESSVTNLPHEFGKMMIEIKKPVGDTDRDSPTFGAESTAKSSAQPVNGKAKDTLGKDLLNTEGLVWDFTKRQREPAGGDGKSQNEFIKMTQMNKNPLGKKVELQMYTLEDIAQHNTASDGWMVINGKVYDVTKYIPYHPGGKKIMPGVGKDGTALYNKYHPWVNANILLEKYHIGFLKK